MSAWTNLLAASSLALGTAWDLITHPNTGGSGTVVNNGMTVALATGSFSVALDAASRQVAVADNRVAVTVADSEINASFSPPITIHITTNPLGAS